MEINRATINKQSFLYKVKHLWFSKEWYFVGGLSIIAIILGTWGFRWHARFHNEDFSLIRSLYRALQLFVLQSGDVLSPVGTPLGIARFLAPFVAFYAIVKLLSYIFYEQFSSFLLRHFYKNHIIVCGLGKKGYTLTKKLLEKGYRVAVIQKNGESDFIRPSKELGAIVFIGDARDPGVLRKAGINRAKYLISLCEDDSINSEIALSARQIKILKKGHILNCIIYIADPLLCSALKQHEVQTKETIPFRLEFFNPFTCAARAVLNEFPAFSEKDRNIKIAPNVLIIGIGKMGENLIVHLVRKWMPYYEENNLRIKITVLDKDIKNIKEILLLRYPQIEQYCELITYQIDINSPEFLKGEFLYNERGINNFSIIYICFDDDALNLYTALTLSSKTKISDSKIVIRMTQTANLITLLKETPAQPFKNIHIANLLDLMCSTNMIIGSTTEIIAKKIHEDYVENERRKGYTVETNPSMVSWDTLPEYKRESNRLQADHINFKLNAIGCEIVPLSNWNAGLFEFTEDEVELLAELEHERWLEEKKRQGWTYAPGPKNDKKKTNPCILSWEQLSEEDKDKDRVVVRDYPKFLAEIDLEIYRIPIETIARALHEQYVREQKKKGETNLSNPYMIPWYKLPEAKKNLYRKDAEYIIEDLQSIDCGIKQVFGSEIKLLDFTNEEVEQLAKRKYGRQQNNIEKEKVFYWEQLSKEEKELNKEAIRNLPNLLAKVGLEIYHRDNITGIN